jgi:chemosensory pili system protein ChpC
MSDKNQTLACVMIPMIGRQLLLPNVSLAEVVDYSPDVTTGADAPTWLAGYLEWRGLRLPVISYDAASGGQLAQPNNRRGRVVILNSIVEEHRDQPFIALMTQGIPSQNRINQSQIQRLDTPTGIADLMEVEVDGERAWIPNLEYLESLTQQLR